MHDYIWRLLLMLTAVAALGFGIAIGYTVGAANRRAINYARQLTGTDGRSDSAVASPAPTAPRTARIRANNAPHHTATYSVAPTTGQVR